MAGARASLRLRTGLNRRRREGRVGRCPARCDGRSVESGFNRENTLSDYRRDGQYRLPDLLPGSYTVTFTLSGFTTLKRDGVEVGGGGVTTISENLRVGNVSETITVTGETPVVDVQTSAKRQVVLTNSVIAALPASRGYGNLLATVPGISGTGLDVSSNVATNFFTARGGRGNEGTIQIDGMNVGSAFNGGGVAGFGYPIAEASEVQMTIAGGLGEVDRGGPQ